MLIDFVLIFALILSTFMGFRRGFSQMLISFVAFFASILGVSVIYNFLGDTIFNSKWAVSLIGQISNNLSSQIENSSILAELPIFNLNIGNTGFLEQFSIRILKILMAIPLILVSFLILKIAIYAIRKIVSKATKIPVISGVDSVLGLILGGLSGLVISFLIYYAISYLQFIPEFDFLKEQYNESLIVMLMSDIF